MSTLSSNLRGRPALQERRTPRAARSGCSRSTLATLAAVSLARARHRQPSTTSRPIERAVPATIRDRRVDVVGVQVRQLQLRDLAHLRAWSPARPSCGSGSPEPFSIFAARFSSTRRRRRPQLEGEGAVGVDRDHRRDDQALLVLRTRVERLAELHDVDAVLAERGAHRRRTGSPPRPGTAASPRLRPSSPCSLSSRGSERTPVAAPPRPALLRPSRRSCSRASRASRDRRPAPSPAPSPCPDAPRRRSRRSSRTGRSTTRTLSPSSKQDLGLRLDRTFLHLRRHAGDVVVRDRRRLVAAADEAGDLRRVLHDVPGLVGRAPC